MSYRLSRFMSTATAGYGACDYLLSADVEMQAAAYAGHYGDFVLRPDLRTARPLPWRDRTVLVLADAVGRDGAPVPVAPRQILRTQLDRDASTRTARSACDQGHFPLERHRSLPNMRSAAASRC